MTASWLPTAVRTAATSLISVNISGRPSPAGRRCSTVTRSPLSASARATPRPSIPLAPVTSTRTLPPVLRPTGPSTGEHPLCPAGEALPVDLCGVPDIHRQRSDDQHSCDAHLGCGAYGAGKLVRRQPNRGAGLRDHYRHHLLSAPRAHTDDRGAGYRAFGLDALLHPYRGERSVGGRDDVHQTALNPQPPGAVEVPDIARTMPARIPRTCFLRRPKPVVTILDVGCGHTDLTGDLEAGIGRSRSHAKGVEWTDLDLHTRQWAPDAHPVARTSFLQLRQRDVGQR